jgi:hypothetical protein
MRSGPGRLHWHLGTNSSHIKVIILFHERSVSVKHDVGPSTHQKFAVLASRCQAATKEHILPRLTFKHFVLVKRLQPGISMTAETSALQVENEQWLAMPASKGLQRPPTRTKLQILPFNELDWENFERLCYRLAKAYGDVDRWAVLYGARGQKQDGIDVYSRRAGAQRYCCWQSKRYKQLTKARLITAIREFENGLWAVKVKSSLFVLLPLSRTLLFRKKLNSKPTD